MQVALSVHPVDVAVGCPDGHHPNTKQVVFDFVSDSECMCVHETLIFYVVAKSGDDD